MRTASAGTCVHISRTTFRVSPRNKALLFITPPHRAITSGANKVPACYGHERKNSAFVGAQLEEVESAPVHAPLVALDPFQCQFVLSVLGFKTKLRCQTPLGNLLPLRA
jgi:hypothetical protein